MKICLFLNCSVLVWINLVLWFVYVHGSVTWKVRKTWKMKSTVLFCCSIVPLRVWECSFFSATFARRLHRCAATPTTTERVTFKSSTAGLTDCTFEWFWTARILTSAHHSDMLRKRHSDLLRKWITEPHQMMIQKSVESRIFKQLANWALVQLVHHPTEQRIK